MWNAISKTKSRNKQTIQSRILSAMDYGCLTSSIKKYTMST